VLELIQSAAFATWLAALRDREANARILARLDRVRLGNFGDTRSVGGGVFELRVDHGPGYRLYYARRGLTVVLLLVGGDKSTQAADIARAQAMAAEQAKARAAAAKQKGESKGRTSKGK
jgi:putative addiction module killer protein